MTPSVFPQRFSLYRRERRYLLEFSRNDQKLSHTWDPAKPFPIGTPARFWLHKENGRIRLMDTRTSKGIQEIAQLKFNAPVSLKIHSTDAAPWIITLRNTLPVEPIAFQLPETLDIPIVGPPYYLYSGYRRQLLNHRQVQDKFRIQIGKTAVFKYELKNGQHLITPQQDEVTWRTFEGECHGLIKGVAFALDDTPFLAGWVEWQQHWWRMMPLTAPEGTEMFVVQNQDPGFFSRNTSIAVGLVAWMLWLFVPMKVTKLPPPAETATLTVQTTPRFNPPLPAAELLRRRKLEDVLVNVTESVLPAQEEEEATVIGSSDPVEQNAKQARTTRIPSRRGRRSFYMGENIDVRGDGILEPQAVQRYLERHAPEVQSCHNELLKKRNGQKGEITMTWVITQFGKADRAKITKAEVTDAEFQTCLMTIIKRMDFPRPQSGPVDVTYQFYFEGMN